MPLEPRRAGGVSQPREWPAGGAAMISRKRARERIMSSNPEIAAAELKRQLLLTIDRETDRNEHYTPPIIYMAAVDLLVFVITKCVLASSADDAVEDACYVLRRAVAEIGKPFE
jgi:hypothetical protein